jgi:hypothetical protein
MDLTLATLPGEYDALALGAHRQGRRLVAPLDLGPYIRSPVECHRMTASRASQIRG